MRGRRTRGCLSDLRTRKARRLEPTLGFPEGRGLHYSAFHRRALDSLQRESQGPVDILLESQIHSPSWRPLNRQHTKDIDEELGQKTTNGGGSIAERYDRTAPLHA